MEKIWLKHYREGVPHQVNPSNHATLTSLVDNAILRFKDKDAYSCMGTNLSYAEVDRLSRNLGAYFQNAWGLKKGDRIALMLPNILQYPIAIFAALRAGLVIVNVNPLYTARELEHQLNNSGTTAIVILENVAHVLQAVLPKTKIKHIITASIGEMLDMPKSMVVDFVIRHVKRLVPEYSLSDAISFKTALAKGKQLVLRKPALVPNDIAFLQYTGGTTGVSKGAILRHRNIVANVDQAYSWLRVFGFGPEPMIAPLPIYHIFSLMANIFLGFSNGAINVLIPNPRDIKGFVKELKQHKFAVFVGVNTLFNALVANPEFTSIDFSSLKITIGGGAAVRKVTADAWLKATGHKLSQAYGLTETSPGLTINDIFNPVDEAAGFPFPSTEISIHDDNGNEVPIGESGEVWARGPQVFDGYWENPEESAKVLTSDGWFKTGDIGLMLENGLLKLVDRKKDMINVSGLKVFPNEVEDVVSMIPEVADVAAIGVEDVRSGEVVKIFVVKKKPELTEETVLAHCRQHLAPYKVPRMVEFRTDLPKTNVGKILRRELR